MLKNLKLFPILDGVRGGIKYDINNITDIIQKVSNVFLVYYKDLQSLEINPLRVTKNGVICLDALLERN